jgi:hypothetical protein
MILAAAIYLGTAASASAHHSHPYMYDQCKSVTVEGRVEAVDWKDPHTLITVRLDDGTAYRIDWNGLMGLTRNRVLGPAQSTLVPGARVVVTGSPVRTLAEIRGRFPDYNHPVNPNTIDPRGIRRVDDSFTWAMPPQAKPPACGGQ